MLHSIIYRRQVLVQFGLRLPKKVSYHDNLFEQMKHVHSIYYLLVEVEARMTVVHGEKHEPPRRLREIFNWFAGHLDK